MKALDREITGSSLGSRRNSLTWLDRIKRSKKLDPINLKKQIEDGIIAAMIGRDLKEKQRAAAEVNMELVQTRVKRRSFLMNMGVLLEM